MKSDNERREAKIVSVTVSLSQMHLTSDGFVTAFLGFGAVTDTTECWAIFRIARPMDLRTLAGRREYVGTYRSYDRTISARLKDARMRCTAEMHVWVHK